MRAASNNNGCQAGASLHLVSECIGFRNPYPQIMGCISSLSAPNSNHPSTSMASFVKGIMCEINFQQAAALSGCFSAHDRRLVASFLPILEFFFGLTAEASNLVGVGRQRFKVASSAPAGVSGSDRFSTSAVENCCFTLVISQTGRDSRAVVPEPADSARSVALRVLLLYCSQTDPGADMNWS
jgi:hypothetical protein